MISVLHTSRVSNVLSVMFSNMSLNFVMGLTHHRVSVALCLFTSQFLPGSFQLLREYSLEPLFQLEFNFSNQGCLIFRGRIYITFCFCLHLQERVLECFQLVSNTSHQLCERVHAELGHKNYLEAENKISRTLKSNCINTFEHSLSF